MCTGSTSPTGDAVPRSAGLNRLGETGQRVFESLSLGLVVFDRNLRLIDHNPAAAFLVAGHASLADALQAATAEASYQNWGQLLRAVIDRGRQQRFDQVLYRDPDRRERLLSLQCIPLPDTQAGQVQGGVLVIEDITQTVGLEKRLAVSERMAAVGKLAARVAHELNNPLDGILRYLNLATRAVETGATDRLADYLNHARGGLLRMTQIVRELVEFSRGAHGAFDEASINAIVEEAIKVMADQAGQTRVSIVCHLQDKMPTTRGTNLFQVFCNLIKNAIDAMPEGGTLTLTTRVVEREAVIRFEDTGIGLPDDIDRIFEPFFTTKPPGKGTGLGLAVCKEILDKHNGKIVAQRREGGGAILTVRIPIETCAPPRPARPPAATGDAPPENQEPTG